MPFHPLQANVVFSSPSQSLLVSHDSVAKKMFDEVFAEDMELAAPPPPVFDAVGEQHRYVTIRKNGKQPLVCHSNVGMSFAHCCIHHYGQLVYL